MADQFLLEVKNLEKRFSMEQGFLSKSKGELRAVDDVSFTIKQGETLGMVGESGCGKTTVGRCILRLIEPSSGSIRFEGLELTSLSASALKNVRRDLQIIFQDPFGSLTPRMRIQKLLSEPLVVHGINSDADLRTEVTNMLERVGLRPEHMNRYPHEFSGGQRQRIAIARALMLYPKLIIADEPVSALDVSIQAQIINLMVRLQKELNLSYLLISHDLGVVKYMSDRIAVMYLGRIVELADRDNLYSQPFHPYTKALLSAIPVARPYHKGNKVYLGGEVPSPISPPRGCSFHPRCPDRVKACDQIQPAIKKIEEGHYVACHLNRK
jgi:oligopeptide/dipeptide ABC transporter ATP-binding protein